MKDKIPLIVAVVFAGVALFGIYQYLQGQKVKTETVKVVVAKRTIKADDVLQEDQLGLADIAASAYVTGMYYARDRTLLLGQRVNTSIATGAPIFAANIIAEEAFVPDLTPKITIGTRAISIPVREISSVCQLVKPGDRIDVLINYEIPYIRETEVEVPNTGRFKVGQKETEPATIFLLQDVVVMAVDRTIITDERYADPGERGYRGVTLRVTPKEARALAFANKVSEDGYTLLLRNPEDDSILEDYKVASYKTVLDEANLSELLNVRRNFRAVMYEKGQEVEAR